ncbi:alpha/beta fold hydrolase [Aquipuribacter nitratireducens]|uniref:Alpha/beta fold hydrolase n=1 Tax=Aquipuribacter nitratireducens TaxID=650104 RepID=A0ABW0GJP9_9MICO
MSPRPAAPLPARPPRVTPWGLVGLGAGLAAAGAGVAVGVAADRVHSRRRQAEAVFDREGLALLGAVRGEEYVLHTDDGVRLHVEVDEPGPRDAGEAPCLTVVLVHGYGLSSQSWHFQRLSLRGRYRVVTYDQRGHGRSEPGPSGSARIPRLGRDLEAVLDAYAPEGPVVLVGHSMGGMTVMSLAAQRPDLFGDRVHGVGFVATSAGDLGSLDFGLPGGGAVTRVAPNLLALLARRPELVTRGRRMVSDIETLVVRRWSFASPVPSELTRFVADIIASTSIEVVSDYLPGFTEHDEKEALAVLDDLPTLVLVGDQDRMTPPRHSDEIVRMLPGTAHVVVRQAGHLVMLEHPDVVNGHVLDLVARALRHARRPTGEQLTALASASTAKGRGRRRRALAEAADAVQRLVGRPLENRGA